MTHLLALLCQASPYLPGDSFDKAEEQAVWTVIPAQSETFVYDGAGRLVEDGNLTETAEWIYTWDAENRLIIAEQKSLPVAGGFTPPTRKRLAFAYDSQNRRLSKTVYEEKVVEGTPQWVLTKDLRFVYDNWQMLAELDHTFATGTGLAGSAVNRTFLWGPDLSGTMTGAGGVGGLLSTTYQGVTYQVCGDANGNVTGLVPVSGTDAGTLAARYDYDPFGNRVANAGPSVELCPFGFSSKYMDGETNILNFELRGLLLESGRWMARDPIGENGGPGLYLFNDNDSINQCDLLGLKTVSGMVQDGQKIAWKYNYKADFLKNDCILQFNLKINLITVLPIVRVDAERYVSVLDKAMKKKLSRWKLIPAIKGDSRCCCAQIALGFLVTINFNEPTDVDQNVNYQPQAGGRSNMFSWRVEDANVHVHEILHMFGLKDEYLDPANYPNKKTAADLPPNYAESVMHQEHKSVLSRHIEEIVEKAAIDELKNCGLKAVQK